MPAKKLKDQPTDTSWQEAQTVRIASAIRDIRGARSVQWVSDQTEVLGQRVGRSTIADLELGRRKYVAVHEIALIAAALGVTPAALLTHGALPDGELELLPGRNVDGLAAADWWGGTPISRFSPAAAGLPADHAQTAELVGASRERARLRDTLVRTQIGGMNEYPDPGLAPALRERLQGAIRRIAELGGVIRDAT